MYKNYNVKALNIDGVLNADCRTTAGAAFIQEKLREIKPFAKIPYSDGNISLDRLEKLAYILGTKYNIIICLLADPDYFNGDSIIWECCVKLSENATSATWCYGASFYEMFAKAILVAYAMRVKWR